MDNQQIIELAKKLRTAYFDSFHDKLTVKPWDDETDENRRPFIAQSTMLFETGYFFATPGIRE